MHISNVQSLTTINSILKVRVFRMTTIRTDHKGTQGMSISLQVSWT